MKPIDEMNLEEVEDELGKVYGEVVEGRNKLLYDRWKELGPKPCCDNCGTEETSVMNVFGGHWCKECWNLFEEERKKKTEKRYKRGGSSRTTIK